MPKPARAKSKRLYAPKRSTREALDGSLPQNGNAAKLSQYEKDLLRRALEEAVESVAASLNSFLPSDREQFTERDKQMFSKWSGRLSAYKTLLKRLGGEIRGELTSAQEMGNS